MHWLVLNLVAKSIALHHLNILLRASSASISDFAGVA